jgi:hypothetical protein
MISFKNDHVSSSLKHKCDYYILEALKEQKCGGGGGVVFGKKPGSRIRKITFVLFTWLTTLKQGAIS